MYCSRKIRGFTLVEALVVLGVVAALIGLSSVAMRGVMEKAEAARSVANLRQCTAGILGLASMRDGSIIMRSGGTAAANATVAPEHQFWAQQLERQMDFTKREVFFSGAANHGLTGGLYSPDARTLWPWRVSYGVNFTSEYWDELPRATGQPVIKALRLVKVEKPSQMALLASSMDANGFGSYAINPEVRSRSLHLRYNGKALVGFMDGSVRLLGPEELAQHGFTGGYGKNVTEWISFLSPPET